MNAQKPPRQAIAGNSYFVKSRAPLGFVQRFGHRQPPEDVYPLKRNEALKLRQG
jgi:hypothetical protein